MNSQAVVGWMKSNLVIVVCVVVIIGAPAGLWYVSSGLSEELTTSVEKRGGQLDRLASAGKADFAWPGSFDSAQVIVTPDLVTEFRAQASLLEGQADDVKSQANTLNSAGFENPFPELLPYPSAEAWLKMTEQDRDAALFQALQVQPERMHARLLKLYAGLLEQVNAGQPPDPQEVRDRLMTVRETFTDGGANEQALDENERADLDLKLGAERLAIYEERAASIGMYLTLETLAPPSFAKTDIPEHEAIAQWMWRYWVLQRLAGGIQTVNGGTSEVAAAIKRLDRVEVRGLLAMETPAAGDRSFAKGSADGGRGGGSGGSGGTGGSGGPPRGGGGGGSGGPPRGGPGGPPRGPGGAGGASPGGGGFGAPTGPAAPAHGATDRTKSVTGRITNQLYDVVLVDVDMIVATDRVDDVLAAFSKPVETAVLDVVIQGVDVFADLEEGYYYGPGSMSRVVLTIETIWLRDWTEAHLPDGVRASLGFAQREYSSSASDDGMDGPPGMPPGRGRGGPPRGPGRPR